MAVTAVTTGSLYAVAAVIGLLVPLLMSGIDRAPDALSLLTPLIAFALGTVMRAGGQWILRWRASMSAQLVGDLVVAMILMLAFYGSAAISQSTQGLELTLIIAVPVQLLVVTVLSLLASAISKSRRARTLLFATVGVGTVVLVIMAGASAR